MEQNDDEPPIVVLTNGTCRQSRGMEIQASAEIWYGTLDPRNMSFRVPRTLEQTNTTGEILALLYAAQTTPLDRDLHIKTESKLIVNLLTKNLEHAEGIGWINTANKELLKILVSHLRRRNGRTLIEKVNGHDGAEENEGADNLARLETEDEIADVIDLTPVSTLLKPGAQLSKMTQALLYKGIIESTPPHKRKGTESNLQRIQGDIKALNGSAPTVSRIWQSLGNKIITKKCRNFLWKAIHEAFKIGQYWNHIPECGDRGICPRCGESESMEHILTKCKYGSQAEIWDLTKTLWEKTNSPWKAPTLGLALGSQLVNTERSKADRGLNNLFTILITESAYLIWNLRCEWRIRRKSDPAALHSKTEITNRWKKHIQNKIRMDYLTSDQTKMGVKARDRTEVDNTWRHIIPPDENETLDWRRVTGVLAGMGIT
ncbi:hypothetical protein H0H93_009054 [Arthromyces matolae]|nr:hypothetical protein H0H93_009054 [Arthromyces matolae]